MLMGISLIMSRFQCGQYILRTLLPSLRSTHSLMKQPRRERTMFLCLLNLFFVMLPLPPWSPVGKKKGRERKSNNITQNLFYLRELYSSVYLIYASPPPFVYYFYLRKIINGKSMVLIWNFFFLLVGYLFDAFLYEQLRIANGYYSPRF